MPTLIVLRHAKAEAPGGTSGTGDADRPLTSRGRRDAGAAGDRLRAASLIPDRVLCSPALRTRQTLTELALAAPVAFDPRIYGNDAEEILDLLREQPEDARTVLLVGHNPALHHLVFDLAGAASDRFPTSATAVIEFAGGWSDLWPGGGRLVSLWEPER